MEYGWNRVHTKAEDDRASVRSTRSSIFSGTYGRKTNGIPADKIFVNDWNPPPAASMPSPLDEESQLEALGVYVRTLNHDLDLHKSVEEPMSRMVRPAVPEAFRLTLPSLPRVPRTR
jgi:PH/SEC7 domain-containing protein